MRKIEGHAPTTASWTRTRVRNTERVGYPPPRERRSVHGEYRLGVTVVLDGAARIALPTRHPLTNSVNVCLPPPVLVVLSCGLIASAYHRGVSVDSLPNHAVSTRSRQTVDSWVSSASRGARSPEGGSRTVLPSVQEGHRPPSHRPQPTSLRSHHALTAAIQRRLARVLRWSCSPDIGLALTDAPYHPSLAHRGPHR